MKPADQPRLVSPMLEPSDEIFSCIRGAAGYSVCPHVWFITWLGYTAGVIVTLPVYHICHKTVGSIIAAGINTAHSERLRLSRLIQLTQRAAVILLSAHTCISLSATAMSSSLTNMQTSTAVRLQPGQCHRCLARRGVPFTSRRTHSLRVNAQVGD